MYVNPWRVAVAVAVASQSVSLDLVRFYSIRELDRIEHNLRHKAGTNCN